jgi:glycosyltransferase involved in cell wall biosynthesis
MTSPLISVILPVYNGAITLSDAIYSVLEQTFKNYEILLLDDGSTDGSLDVARTFSDSRLRVIHDGVNRGLAYRLNQGIDLAQGRYIARMDQDDICFPERLAKQFEFLETSPEIDLLGCRVIVFRNSHDIVGLTPFCGTHEEICAYPWRGLYLAAPTWMGRVEWFRRHRYRIPEAVHADDQELLLRAYPDSRFACMEEVLLAYRKESFRSNKTWRARKALLKVHLSHFIRRRQWSNMSLSVVFALSKMAVDLVYIMAGNKGPVFRQISESVSEELAEEFHKLVYKKGLYDEAKG